MSCPHQHRQIPAGGGVNPAALRAPYLPHRMNRANLENQSRSDCHSQGTSRGRGPDRCCHHLPFSDSKGKAGITSGRTWLQSSAPRKSPRTDLRRLRRRRPAGTGLCQVFVGGIPGRRGTVVDPDSAVRHFPPGLRPLLPRSIRSPEAVAVSSSTWRLAWKWRKRPC